MRTDLEIATEWIRGFSATYLPSEGSFKYSASVLRSRGISLLDLLCLFESAHVVSASMNDDLDGQQAVWVVEGFDSDDRPMEATLCVETESMSVEIMDAARIVSTVRANNGAD